MVILIIPPLRPEVLLVTFIFFIVFLVLINLGVNAFTQQVSAYPYFAQTTNGSSGAGRNNARGPAEGSLLHSHCTHMTPSAVTKNSSSTAIGQPSLLSNTSSITVSGLGFSGILTQFMGGGQSGTSGSGGAVSLGNNRTINMLGASSIGILAQSVGGAGLVIMASEVTGRAQAQTTLPTATS